MTRNLGLVATPGAPPATRASRASWRDPRLWVGVAVVAVSVIAGARLLSSSDQMTSVSVADSDVAVGAVLGDVRLRTVEVKVSGEVGASLITPTAGLDPSLVFTRPVRAGELVPRSALSARSDLGLVHVPISVDPDQVPPSVEAGAVVDIYVIERGTRISGRAEPALEAANVVAAPDPASAVVSTGKRQLVVAVPDAEARAFFATLGAADQATVTVVRRQ